MHRRSLLLKPKNRIEQHRRHNSQAISADLTDPISIALMKVDIKILDEKLTILIAGHRLAHK